LDRIGEKSNVHRCHKLPFDAKLKKKKKYKRPKELPKLLGRENCEELYEKMKHDFDGSVAISKISEKQKDELCRGKEIRPLNEIGKLKCFYGHNDSPWLKIGPFKIEENALDPYHVTILELLYEHECNDITEFLGPMLNFPPGRMNLKTKKNDWTMKNCWPNEAQNVNLQKLNLRIEHIAGLNANSFKNYSEPYMCGNYGIGGHYWIHPDYHQPNLNHYMPSSSGNRVATVLTVLENPEAGGATIWPYAGISVFGKKGSGIFWHNLRKNDSPDVNTQHAACPVLLGQKWIGNKWVGYNSQWNRRNCHTKAETLFDPIRNFQKL
jgi:prolyl 4-hydroxylase